MPDGVPPLLLNQRVLNVRSIDKKLATWIAKAGATKAFRDFFFSNETGGVNQGNVGVGGVMRGPIPVTSLEEIREVILKVEKSFDVILKFELEIAALERELDIMDQSILNKAFSGELMSNVSRPKSFLDLEIERLNHWLAENRPSKLKEGAFLCPICLNMLDVSVATREHIIPASIGGTTKL